MKHLRGRLIGLVGVAALVAGLVVAVSATRIGQCDGDAPGWVENDGGCAEWGALEFLYPWHWGVPDQCLGLCTGPPTPGMRDVELGLNEEGFVPAADVRPMCEALAIVDERIQPAFAEFEQAVFVDDRQAMAAAGGRIYGAGVEIEELAAGAGQEVAPYVLRLGRGFQEDGRRATEGDFSDGGTRHSIGGLLRRFDSACFGLTPANRGVTRGVLAEVIAHHFELPEASEDFFTDDEGSNLEDAINRVAAAGLLTGCDDSKFCPDETATRGLMAVVLVRLLDLPRTDVDYFTDDDESPFEPFINRIAAAGLASGPRSGGYRPNDGLARRPIVDFLKHVERLNR